MRKWILFAALSIVSFDLLAQTAPLTISDFDQHYRKKFRTAFCSDSIYNDCFAQATDSCLQKFDPIFSSCVQKAFPKRSVAANELSSEKFQQLGKCIGTQLTPQGAKVRCRQRSSEF